MSLASVSDVNHSRSSASPTAPPAGAHPPHSRSDPGSAAPLPLPCAGWQLGPVCCFQGTRQTPIARGWRASADSLNALLHGSHCVLVAEYVSREQLCYPEPSPPPCHLLTPCSGVAKNACAWATRGAVSENPTLLCPWGLASYLCGGGSIAQPGHADSRQGGRGSYRPRHTSSARAHKVESGQCLRPAAGACLDSRPSSDLPRAAETHRKLSPW